MCIVSCFVGPNRTRFETEGRNCKPVKFVLKMCWINKPLSRFTLFAFICIYMFAFSTQARVKSVEQRIKRGISKHTFRSTEFRNSWWFSWWVESESDYFGCVCSVIYFVHRSNWQVNHSKLKVVPKTLFNRLIQEKVRKNLLSNRPYSAK